jgi:hypothetical protein
MQSIAGAGVARGGHLHRRCPEARRPADELLC